MRFSSLTAYCYAMLFILGWWGSVFYHRGLASSRQSPLVEPSSDLLGTLSPINREELRHHLLLDNVRAMAQKIEQWDQEASALHTTSGVAVVPRLCPEKLLLVRLLAGVLEQSSSVECSQGVLVYPQTVAAATFLLAIASREQIFALPEALFAARGLYPREKIENIPAACAKIEGEHYFQRLPDLACIAPYSNPDVASTLRSLGIPLIHVDPLDSVEHIQEALLALGRAVQRPLHAMFLRLFMEAACIAIDQRLLALPSGDVKRICCVVGRERHGIPTTKSLQGQLLQRALKHCPRLMCHVPESSTSWYSECDQEQLMAQQADALLISSYGGADLVKEHLGALAHTPCYFLDDAAQNSPTQYIVLAYLDIATACAHILSDQDLYQDLYQAP